MRQMDLLSGSKNRSKADAWMREVIIMILSERGFLLALYGALILVCAGLGKARMESGFSIGTQTCGSIERSIRRVCNSMSPFFPGCAEAASVAA